MHHGSLRAPVRVFMAAVLLCLSFLAAPKAAAAQLQNVNGITLLSFDSQQIVSIGNQTSGRCSWYALRYARTILDGKPCSGSGMWSNGAVWSAAGTTLTAAPFPTAFPACMKSCRPGGPSSYI